MGNRWVYNAEQLNGACEWSRSSYMLSIWWNVVKILPPGDNKTRYLWDLVTLRVQRHSKYIDWHHYRNGRALCMSWHGAFIVRI